MPNPIPKLPVAEVVLPIPLRAYVEKNQPTIREYCIEKRKALAKSLNIKLDDNSLLIPNLIPKTKIQDGVEGAAMSLERMRIRTAKDYTVISKTPAMKAPYGNPFGYKIMPFIPYMRKGLPSGQRLSDVPVIAPTKLTDVHTNMNRLQFYKNKSDLSYICEKTYPKTKPILQNLVALYAYSKYMRGDPHQVDPMIRQPFRKRVLQKKRRPLLMVYERKLKPEGSVTAQVMDVSFPPMKPVPEIKFELYNPHGAVKMFKFDVPYPY